MESSIRNTTKKAYDVAWKQWAKWCEERNISPISKAINPILEYLSDLWTRGLAYNTINIHRSMLATTLDFDGIRGNQLVKQLLKAMYDTRPPRPKYSTTWPIENVLELLKSWGPNDQLNLRRLSKNTAMLLALTTFLRFSELATIVSESVVFSLSGVSFRLARPRKAQRSGPLCSFRIETFQDPLLCPVACLRRYIQDTTKVHGTDNVLMIGTVPPHKPVGSSSIARWLKLTMTEAGIDSTIFSAHSTRGAASSRALDRGLPVDVILQAGGWSIESTFLRFYRRQAPETSVSQAILGNN